MAKRSKGEEAEVPEEKPEESKQDRSEDETQEVPADIKNPEVLQTHLHGAVESEKRLRHAILQHKLHNRHSTRPVDAILYRVLES